LGRVIGYMIGFRGGRPLLERPGRTQKFRLKTIDKGEKLFERFTWLGALAAPGPVSGINKVPVQTFVFASIVAALGWTLSTGLAAYLAYYIH
jgi:membrane protein DedA with SNARE-associated domain